MVKTKSTDISAVTRSGRVVVLWLQNFPEHYFNAMMDRLNSAADGPMYHSVFLRAEPPNPAGYQLPRNTPVTYLPTAKKGRGPNVHAALGGLEFSAAIIGGYDTPFKRRFINYCRRTGRPVIMFADSNIRSERGRTGRARLKRRFKKCYLPRICRNLSGIIPCNKYGVAYWRYYGARHDQIYRSSYFCDREELAAARLSDRSEVLSRHQIGDGHKIIFTAARLVQVKSLDLMIQAFLQCRLADRGWIWLIAGNGPLKAELQQAAQPAGQAIRFMGFVPPPDVKRLARHSELFVLPSTYEPHGIVVAESMAVGTPVIASDVCGAAGDLVKPGITGWIFRNRSVEDLARVLSSTTADPAALAAMRSTCRQTFENWYARYGPEYVIPRMLQRFLNPDSAVRNRTAW